LVEKETITRLQEITLSPEASEFQYHDYANMQQFGETLKKNCGNRFNYKR